MPSPVIFHLIYFILGTTRQKQNLSPGISHPAVSRPCSLMAHFAQGLLGLFHENLGQSLKITKIKVLQKHPANHYSCHGTGSSGVFTKRSPALDQHFLQTVMIHLHLGKLMKAPIYLFVQHHFDTLEGFYSWCLY